MLGIILIVFVAAFLVAALLLLAPGTEGTKQAEAMVGRMQTLIKVSPTIADDVLDFRKKEQQLTNIAWLDRWLSRVDILPRLRLLLYQADLQWTVSMLILSSLACAALAGYAVWWRTGTIPLAVLLALAAGFLPMVFIMRKRSQRFTAFERLLPDALGLMVGALRAGHSLSSTIGMVGREMSDPIAREFRKCFDEQIFGIEIRTAMLNLVTRVPIQPVRIIATAVLIQKESGGNLAEVLDKAAYVIRERFQLQRQVRVHTAQGRLTGLILALLPVLLGFLIYLVNPDYISLLWRRAAGVKLLYAGVTMTILGSLIIRKIVHIRI